jgi:DNA-directed RNA polymerase specialized sigma24 family protein
MGSGTGSLDPLDSDHPAIWDGLIAAVGPASMLAAIRGRMSAALRSCYAPEDVWQEVLLQAWRDRAHCRWEGVSPFRRWLLALAENRLRDLADRDSAAKRGGRGEVPLSTLGSPSTSGACAEHYAGPVDTTTPSRAAMLTRSS